MANICEYRVIVKGPANGCAAFFGSMSCMDYKDIEYIKTKDGEELCDFDDEMKDEPIEMFFTGDCKWAVDAYCDNEWDGPFPVELSEYAVDAFQVAEDEYWYHTVQERARMFGVEVMCNSADVEDYDPLTGPEEYFECYSTEGESTAISGDIDKCPNKLRIFT